jgi:hypothetical protein
MENPPHKVKLRLPNGAEFEAEGAKETVDAQLTAFMKLMADMPMPTAELPKAIHPASAIFPSPSSPVGSAAAVPPELPSPLTDEILSRVFRRDRDSISLLAMPRGERSEGDTLIALLYAYQQLLNQPAVTGVTLSQAARQSGLSLSRLDRVMESQAQYIMAAGARRGRRYSLNNRGVRYAEDLIRRLVE